MTEQHECKMMEDEVLILIKDGANYAELWKEDVTYSEDDGLDYDYRCILYIDYCPFCGKKLAKSE